ncbi:MAG TPA: peptide chain release factor N(5)-glutamine methyltransferase [Porphyromonadaceae bacterium]|jgi:release factor glutamine methyltransferase|nr:peptide chain release factor N(5)-glutamine methyltransferase [Porphyromonadaceae bacterium]HBL34702.1 peptide chain release factor N(5)-glutamine methyltransferase [Porphyromonadaceae bacterium]HBX21963.1 peptide chain release factor N(5)-glutamine methyltransferase [Porphyromonadaceae bacterium]HCM22443.1 peptide chain release factor N(5)-glutamine methyltransferase [Porphyromonadaceae bacterium]
MQNIIDYIVEELGDHYSPGEVKTYVSLILGKVCGISSLEILTRKINKLSNTQHLVVDDIVGRLKNDEPIQYILGSTEFYGLPFLVTPAVLIPRPETEELVEWIITDKQKPNPSILDVGTGSGCIAVTLAKKIAGARVSAWDISSRALDVAEENAANNKVFVRFSEHDLFSSFVEKEQFDVIVSNPPYVLESEKREMEPNVLRYEPARALFVPDSRPLLFYERLADIALALLFPQGGIYMEINRMKGSDVMALFSEKGFIDVCLRKDLSGNDRMVFARKEG